MTGPCLCGDPYCNSCFPGQAQTMKAFDWIEAFFEGESALGFTLCQACPRFTAWGGATSASESGQQCDVLTHDKYDPTDCPAWAKEHTDE